ncbi:glycosyltransferase [Pelagicoccus enzymogenes]|uniref:glycosyltransferase n=1 Tax=Pelagicoccus enzymogenes TaxID=2773457 RepID=UPI00280D95F9|nr:glycosyltransferase [Pelagicoccus enzymogenes]MDQ8198914.1 glycosyltransferase [Pelagicoccus enzymogenes]
MNSSPSQIRTVCVVWQTMGPYHLARLKAAHDFFKERGIVMIAIETAGSKGSLVKEIKRHETPYECVRLFPDRVFEDISPLEMDHAVRSTLYRINPDAVATNSYFLPDTRSALRWCRRNGRVAVTMIDSKEDDAKRKLWREYLKSIIVRQYDAALVAGVPHRSYMKKMGIPGKNIFDGLDVVDNDFFAAKAAEARANPKAFERLPALFDEGEYFLASNRFIPRKNLELLLSAYGAYRERADKPWRLVMLGDGRLRERLEAQVEREGIEGVAFVGMRTIDEVGAYYGYAGAFVHTALVDQWGLVVNEAMATGLPVIVSTGSGCSMDLVDPPKNGYVFESTDGEALVAAMLKVSAAGADRAAMRAESLRIISEWTPSRFASGLYEAVISGGESGPRYLGPVARLVFWLMLKVGKKPAAFASVEA